MKIKYQHFKEVSSLIKNLKEIYWENKLVEKKTIYFTKEMEDSLEIIIEKIDNICTYYNHEDIPELERDFSFIKEYYEIRRWSSVIRWLSNTDSTIYKISSKLLEKFKSKKELIS